MKLWSWKIENLPSTTHSIRTAGAATVSVCVAQFIGMPEAYWAAITTLVVMQSTLGATVTLSIERIVASALGASLLRGVNRDGRRSCFCCHLGGAAAADRSHGCRLSPPLKRSTGNISLGN